MICCRPVDALCMSDRHETSDDMFRLPPVSLLRMPPCEEEAASSGEGFGGADQDTESEMGETEEEASLLLVPSGIESSSAGHTASNLLYLSDQVGLGRGCHAGLVHDLIKDIWSETHKSIYVLFDLCMPLYPW